MTAMSHEIVFSEARPLVTFALFAYNQEKYIREAVEGAFAQSYEPLEIILSDDCSGDSTFDIMTDMVAEYTGHHKIRLQRNNENLGISRHVRRVHEIAKGEFIVHAAGDDYSFPKRVETLVTAFCSREPQPSMVISNALLTNEKLVVIGTLNKNMPKILFERHENPLLRSHPVNGCTVAIHRSLIDIFPPPDNAIVAEDQVLAARAHLVNGVIFLPDLLVKYRISHDSVWGSGSLSSISTPEAVARRKKWIRDMIASLRQVVNDVNLVKKNCRTRKKILDYIDARINYNLCLLTVLEDDHLRVMLDKILLENYFRSTSIVLALISKRKIPRHLKLVFLKNYAARWFESIVRVKSTMIKS